LNEEDADLSEEEGGGDGFGRESISKAALTVSYIPRTHFIVNLQKQRINRENQINNKSLKSSKITPNTAAATKCFAADSYEEIV
jgi:hypothetical protein